MLIIFLRALILYFMVIFSVRLMGKRQIGELQPSELVITILVSNIATLPIEDINIPLATGLIPMISLVCFDVIMSIVTLKFKRIRRVVSGKPRIVVFNGEIDQKALKQLRYSVDDMMEGLREQGVFDIKEVQYAVVETTGRINILQKKDYQPLTLDIVENKNAASQNPPQVIIEDGVVSQKALDMLGLNEKWLNNILNKNTVKPRDVFFLSSDEDKNYTLIKKCRQREG
ncbi:MAG: DUF421 domain-containing protein [Ruminococcus sp.]|nr:DUF421 domain-containing protein [Ruminococcus sp.]MCD7727748.1 DUF421 domain-containing protein [Ruminococcus sp.]